jgi:hypothetical protein
VGITNDVLGDGIAAVNVCVGAAIAEPVVGYALHLYGKIALLFMEESLSVGNEILEIAELRTIHGRVIGLSDNAIPDREPKMAGGGICGTYAGFVAMCPARPNTWLAESFLTNNFLHYYSPPYV